MHYQTDKVMVRCSLGIAIVAAVALVPAWAHAESHGEHDGHAHEGAPVKAVRHAEPAQHGEHAPAAGHGEHGGGEHGAGEHGDGEHGDGEHGGEHHGPIALPWDAINWADFTYQNEESEEHFAQFGVHEPGPPVIATIINFALLLLIIYFLARKPVAAMLQERSDKVREGLTEATKMLEEANERLADYSSRLERMDDEMSKLREEFIAAGEAERDRLVADAGAKAERMRRDAGVRMDQEFAQLRDELRVETVEKAVAAANDALSGEVKETDQRRLADEYLSQLEQEGSGQ